MGTETQQGGVNVRITGVLEVNAKKVRVYYNTRSSQIIHTTVPSGKKIPKAPSHHGMSRGKIFGKSRAKHS